MLNSSSREREFSRSLLGFRRLSSTNRIGRAEGDDNSEVEGRQLPQTTPAHQPQHEQGAPVHEGRSHDDFHEKQQRGVAQEHAREVKNVQVAPGFFSYEGLSEPRRPPRSR